MLNEDSSNSNQNGQVYGFLCQKTNVFYAFESQESYQQFLSWLSTQEAQTDTSACRLSEQVEVPMVNEADQLEDFEVATDEIMGVFNDPVFEKADRDVEMREIDFWSRMTNSFNDILSVKVLDLFWLSSVGLRSWIKTDFQ